jgi:hypothetical protein
MITESALPTQDNAAQLLGRNDSRLQASILILLLGVHAMTNTRAVRYQRLALTESDPENARLLHQLADEADRGVLCTAEWLRRPSIRREPPGGEVKTS